MVKHFLKALITYGVINSIGKIAGLFLVPVYTRCFSPQQYGIIDLVTIAISLISIIGILQLESAIARFFFDADKKGQTILYVSTAFWTVLFLSSICFILTCLLSPLISKLVFKTTDYKFILIAAAISIPLANLLGFFSVLIRFFKKPVLYGIVTLAQLITAIGLSIWLVVFKKIGIIGVFIGQNIGSAVGLILFLIFLRKTIKFAWNKKILINFFAYSLPQVPAVGANMLNSYANRFFMLGYLTMSDIGLYSIALKVASIFTLLQSAFRMAWGPFFWESFQKANHRKIYKNIFLLVVGGVFIFVVGISIFSKEIIQIVASKNFFQSSKLLPFLFLSGGLAIITDIVAVGPDIKKKMMYTTLVYYLGVAINIILLFCLIPTIGLIGVPISLVFSSFFILILFWFISEKMYYIGFNKRFFIVSFFAALIGVVIPMIIEISFTVKLIFTSLILFITIIFILKRNFILSRMTVLLNRS
jgi:O-antigen/teichoic acid export membrane protein